MTKKFDISSTIPHPSSPPPSHPRSFPPSLAPSLPSLPRSFPSLLPSTPPSSYCSLARLPGLQLPNHRSGAAGRSVWEGTWLSGCGLVEVKLGRLSGREYSGVQFATESNLGDFCSHLLFLPRATISEKPYPEESFKSCMRSNV